MEPLSHRLRIKVKKKKTSHKIRINKKGTYRGLGIISKPNSGKLAPTELSLSDVAARGERIADSYRVVTTFPVGIDALVLLLRSRRRRTRHDDMMIVRINIDSLLFLLNLLERENGKWKPENGKWKMNLINTNLGEIERRTVDVCYNGGGVSVWPLAQDSLHLFLLFYYFPSFLLY